MRWYIRWTVVPVLMLMLAAPASGQDPDERRGFWIGFGLGGGHLGCGDCSDEPGGGFSGHLKLGGTPNRRILVGFETVFWAKHDDEIDATLSYGNSSAIVQFYPGERSGFFLKGGLGVAYSELEVDLGGGLTLRETESGLGASFGVGWDARVSRNMSITPALNLSLGSLENANVTLLQLVVGLTWH
jgi:hypothetical protein